MKPTNKLINQALSNESVKQSTAQPLTTGEKDLVNWFFLRLETNYGSKFWGQFSDEMTVKLTKTEWARNIIRHSRDDLHEAIEKAKDERSRGNEDFDWPDIAKILGLLNNRISPDGANSAAYLSFNDPRHPDYRPKALEDKTITSKRKQKGQSALKSLKDIL